MALAVQCWKAASNDHSGYSQQMGTKAAKPSWRRGRMWLGESSRKLAGRALFMYMFISSSRKVRAHCSLCPNPSSLPRWQMKTPIRMEGLLRLTSRLRFDLHTRQCSVCQGGSLRYHDVTDLHQYRYTIDTAISCWFFQLRIIGMKGDRRGERNNTWTYSNKGSEAVFAFLPKPSEQPDLQAQC